MYALARRDRFTRLRHVYESVRVCRVAPSPELAQDSAGTSIWTGRIPRRWWCARNSTASICVTYRGADGPAPVWVSVSLHSSTGFRGRTAGCSPGRKWAVRCSTTAAWRLLNSRSSIASTGCGRWTGTWCGTPGWTPCTKSSCRSCPATGRSTCRAPREVSGCGACPWTWSHRCRTARQGSRWTSGPSCLPETSCARTSWPSIRTRTPVTIVDDIIILYHNIIIFHNFMRWQL